MYVIRVSHPTAPIRPFVRCVEIHDSLDVWLDYRDQATVFETKERAEQVAERVRSILARKYPDAKVHVVKIPEKK